MARTKLTSRKPTGGKPPRAELATSAPRKAADMGYIGLNFANMSEKELRKVMVHHDHELAV